MPEYQMGGVRVTGKDLDGFFSISNTSRGNFHRLSCTREELRRLGIMIDAILKDVPEEEEVRGR